MYYILPVALRKHFQVKLRLIIRCKWPCREHIKGCGCGIFPKILVGKKRRAFYHAKRIG